MFVATKNKILPTSIIGSFPKRTWFTDNLNGKPFKVAMSDSRYSKNTSTPQDFTLASKISSGHCGGLQL